MKRYTLPILEPCDADWDAMDGDGGIRFCRRCQQHVHDLSQLEPSVARTLLARQQQVCVRYSYAADDEILFAPPRAGGVAAAALAIATLASGCMMGKPMPSGARGCEVPRAPVDATQAERPSSEEQAKSRDTPVRPPAPETSPDQE